jgi:hypothetical protein
VFPFVHSFGSVFKLDSESNPFIRCVALLNEQVYSTNLVFHYLALLGCEKLLLQGIPYFRLLLGNETEVNIGDLAGNAMSLPVVCATMLAALTAKELRKATMATKSKNSATILSELQIDQSSEWKPQCIAVDPSSLLSSAMPFFQQLALLADEAVKSSIWCTCETSGSNTSTSKFVQCKLCRVSCCRNCISEIAGYKLDSHDIVEVEISPHEHNLGLFQSKLREIVPSSLSFAKEGLDEIAEVQDDMHQVSALSNVVFSLHRIKREKKKWLLLYYARDDHGIGSALAEIRITMGELKTQATEMETGVLVELTSFMPAKTEPPVYGHLEPCAKLVILAGSSSSSESWSVKDINENSSAIVEGSGVTASARVEVGLVTDKASNDLKAATSNPYTAKDFILARDRGEERRWLYAENWREWPEKISIKTTSGVDSIASDHDILGDYQRAPCRQTTNQSALWVRTVPADALPMYILIQPNIHRIGPDQAVISMSSNHKDYTSNVAVLPRDWQPCDALVSDKMEQALQMKQWRTLTKMKCITLPSAVEVESPKDSDALVSVTGLSATDIRMFSRDIGSDNQEAIKLNVSGGQQAPQVVRVFNSICVAAILKLAAKSGLKYDVSPDAAWIDLQPRNKSEPFGHSKVVVPMRPSEDWIFNEERNAMERTSQPGAARQYYLKLQEAKHPFELILDPRSRKLDIKCFPEVAAHHAAAQLIRGRGVDDSHSVAFKLSDVTQQSDPVTSPFVVRNCNSEEPTNVPLQAPYALYPRQQRVVRKMLSIEEENTSFEELEINEIEMPGSAGLSLIAKASRNRKICGGVIADAIGAGKTVISIAIILNGIEEARQHRSPPQKSSATLVVVPPALIDQWESEIHKFTTSLTVLKIFDHATLAETKIKQILEADVVVIPIDILESSGYLDSLIKAAKLKDHGRDVPKLPPYAGQLEQNAARGVWIPATSQDPYGGGNNPLSQRRREQSAYYTFIYLKAIAALREQTFKPTDKGVPLEYFEWERIIVDEIHESLCTTKAELDVSKEAHQEEHGNSTSGFFREKNRRAGRELLGITQKDISKRPLVCRGAIFGLTGTPLLDSTSRVTELANLMGGTYVIGLSSHWRKLERESCRDIFLQNYLDPKQSREIRKTIMAKCQVRSIDDGVFSCLACLLLRK